MIKKLINWWLSVYKAGKPVRTTYSNPRPYKPTVLQRLKATMLIFFTGILALFVAGLAIALTKGLVLFLIPVGAIFAVIYFLILSDW